MNFIYSFLLDFRQKKGFYIFSTSIILKLSFFILQIIVLKLLSLEDFGYFTYFTSIFSFFAILSGFGVGHTILRFGAKENNVYQKKLIEKLFIFGFYSQIVISLLFFLFVWFQKSDYEDIIILALYLSIRLIGVYFLELKYSIYRTLNDNKGFSKLQLSFAITNFVLSVIFTYFYLLKGLIFASMLSPFIFIFFENKLKYQLDFKIDIDKNLIKYGLYAIIANIIPEAIYLLDIMLADHFLSIQDVGIYKATIMIPFNLTIFSHILMTTYYPSLCKNIDNYNYIFSFIKKIIKIELLLLIVIILFIVIFKEMITSILFSNYSNQNHMIILSLMSMFMWFSKHLFSYLHSAKATLKHNIYSGIVSLIGLFFFGIILIPNYKLEGLIISVIICHLLGALYSTFSFWYIHLRLNPNK